MRRVRVRGALKVCVGAALGACVLSSMPVSAEANGWLFGGFGRSYDHSATSRHSGTTTTRSRSALAHAGAAGHNARVDVVHFPASYQPGSIVVSFSDKRLYYVQARGRAVSYPVAAPRPQSRWAGTLKISQKRVNPAWTPTARMLRENPRLPRHVAGGDPRNPLGTRALYLGSTLYRIHGTDAPWTIGQPVSKGCIRMHNSHVEDLYRKVTVGTPVKVTYASYRYSS